MVEVKNLNTAALGFMLGLFRDKTKASAFNVLINYLSLKLVFWWFR